MAHFYQKLILLAFILPVCLGMSVVMRQTAISFIYLVYFLIHPRVTATTVAIMSEMSPTISTKCYLLTIPIISGIILLAHCGFQIVLLLNLDIDDMALKFLHHLGLKNLIEGTAVDSFLFLCPDIMVFLCSIWINMVFFKVKTPEELMGRPCSEVILSNDKWIFITIKYGNGLALIFLCFAGGITPSILNGVYFILFLAIMTWWASYRDFLDYSFGRLLHMLKLFIAIHAFALLSLQTKFVLANVNTESKFIRYLGLKPLTRADKEPDVEEHIISDYVPTLLNPILVLSLYYIVSLEANLLTQVQGEYGNTVDFE